MTIADRRAEEDRDALAREAAHWFARMRAPDAKTSRGAFDAWLAQRPEHRSAYNHAAEVFAMGKLLADADEPAPAKRRRKVPAIALVAIIACVVGIGGWAGLHPAGPSLDRREATATTTDHRRISTVLGETRVVQLADGSTVRLGSDTALEIDIGSSGRSLKLLRGQARFEVAHDRRPFVVLAGGGSVTARGTIFEVALTRSGKVDVRLLQGAVDVGLPHLSTTSGPPVRKLVAGESVSFAGQPEAAEPRTSSASAAMIPAAAVRDFEAISVAELVAIANRGAGRPIRVADSALGAKRVSGRFRIDDTELLARRLGALFDRTVDVSNPREIVMAAAEAGTS